MRLAGVFILAVTPGLEGLGGARLNFALPGG